MLNLSVYSVHNNFQHIKFCQFGHFVFALSDDTKEYKLFIILLIKLKRKQNKSDSLVTAESYNMIFFMNFSMKSGQIKKQHLRDSPCKCFITSVILFI